MARKPSFTEKYVPPASAVPGLLVFGALGAAIAFKLLPGAINKLQSVIPTIGNKQ